jgi:hypothetical protein
MSSSFVCEIIFSSNKKIFLLFPPISFQIDMGFNFSATFMLIKLKNKSDDKEWRETFSVQGRNFIEGKVENKGISCSRPWDYANVNFAVVLEFSFFALLGEKLGAAMENLLVDEVSWWNFCSGNWRRYCEVHDEESWREIMMS